VSLFISTATLMSPFLSNLPWMVTPLFLFPLPCAQMKPPSLPDAEGPVKIFFVISSNE